MHRISRAVLAVSGIALASALSAAAAAEDKSTKPRIAVIEFQGPAGGTSSPPLEILGFAWGESGAAGPMKPVFVKSWTASGDGEPPPAPPGGINQMSMDDTAGKEKSAARTAVAHDLRTNVIARTAPPMASASGRGLDIARVDGEIVSPSAAGGDPDRPIVAGRVPNPAATRIGANETITVGGARTETAFGQRRLPAGSKLTVRVSTPLAKGSVWVRVASPWAACRVGARYPSLQLADSAQSYTLEDVTVASCGDADDRPTEEVAFYYNKVRVRGWDPEKKEE